jgi:hypothetical protein
MKVANFKIKRYVFSGIYMDGLFTKIQQAEVASAVVQTGFFKKRKDPLNRDPSF